MGFVADYPDPETSTLERRAQVPGLILVLIIALDAAAWLALSVIILQLFPRF